MNKSTNAIHQLSLLEKLFDELIRPLPTFVSIEVRDLRGGQICCQIKRTPPRTKPPSSTTHTE